MTDPAILLIVAALVITIISLWRTRGQGGNYVGWALLLVCIYLLLPLARKLLHV